MKRFLFVDDNVAFAENLAEIVRDAGDEVTVVSSGAEAVELVRSTRFDALLTDMRMPVMSGAALVHAIRAVDRGLPAIVVTAYTGESDLEAALHDGLLAVLPKPAPIPRLLSLLKVARREGLVALVDDDSTLADNLSELLRDRGFSPVLAASVAEASRLGGVKPFAAIVDLRMPGGPDGAALKLLLERDPALPVLVMSGHEDAVAKTGCQPAFVKPFDSNRLLEAVEKLWR